MQNEVELLENDVIYVQKVGDQTEQSMKALLEKIIKLAANLRSQNKPVLILSNAEQEGKTDINARKKAAEIGKTLDYDKSATYGSSQFEHKARELMISATQLQEKVASFATRDEALAWLLK